MEQESQNQPEEHILIQEQTLFSWRAPVRPFKERSRQFFTTVVLVAILLSLIGYVLEGVMVVFLIWAVVFLVFVLFMVQPEEIDYTITNKYIIIAGKKYRLEEISRFWIIDRWEHKLLVFETPLRFPGRLELVLSGVDQEELKEKLTRYIPFEEESPGFVDKAASWLSKRLLLDT